MPVESNVYIALFSGMTIAASVLVSVSPLNVPKPTRIPPLALILPEAVIWSTFFMSFPPKSKSWVAVWLPKLSAAAKPESLLNADIGIFPANILLGVVFAIS